MFKEHILPIYIVLHAHVLYVCDILSYEFVCYTGTFKIEVGRHESTYIKQLMMLIRKLDGVFSL